MAKNEGVELKNPSHPGGFARREIAEPLGLTVTEAARILGVTRPALSALFNERARLSPEMALRIEKAFGVRADTLLRMQLAHDIARMRAREDEIDVAPYWRGIEGPPLSSDNPWSPARSVPSR